MYLYHHLSTVKTLYQLSTIIMMTSRAELKELMGIDDSQWETARYFQDLLQALHQQREKNITAKRGDYHYAAHKMFFLDILLFLGCML